jgi:hypothetical protein
MYLFRNMRSFSLWIGGLRRATLGLALSELMVPESLESDQHVTVQRGLTMARSFSIQDQAVCPPKES